MNDPQRSIPPATRATSVIRELSVDEDEQPLGWECANPALQIERWLQDITGAEPLVSSKS